MNEFEVRAEARSATGKGAVRRLRRQGMVPGVVYGAGGEPVAIAMEVNTLRKQLDNEAFFSHILTLNLDGGDSAQAVVKALQREPVSGDVIHLDFLRVSATHELHMSVPLHFLNEEHSPGRIAGGVVSHLLTEVEIGCLPKDLPEYIEVDIGGLDIGDSIHLSDLVMPEGVTLMALAHGDVHDNDQTVVSVQHAQKAEEDEDEGAEDEDGLEAAAEGEGEGEGEDGEQPDGDDE